jgi:hypothetical protein
MNLKGKNDLRIYYTVRIKYFVPPLSRNRPVLPVPANLIYFIQGATMPRHFLFLLFAVLSLAFAGCYTRLAEFPPAGAPAAADTVRPSDSSKETCVWERDLAGFPRLHCYPLYYPRQWYRYNYSPWWYHSDRYLYSKEKCPPYYYLDPTCGCCRYYLNNPDLVRAPGGGVIHKKTEDAPPQHDSNRVSVTVSAGSGVFIPLHGNTAPPDNASLPPASAQGTAPDSTAAQNANHGRDTMTVVPVNTLRRSLRGR